MFIANIPFKKSVEDIDFDKFEKMMSTMERIPITSFKRMYATWYKCFAYTLKSFKAGYTDKAIAHMFRYFDMCNWEQFHLDNSKYKDIPEEIREEVMYKDFCGECRYVYDRMSYDRLFRVHWLFLQIYEKEISDLHFGETS